jgi:hypothetical protein
MRKIGILVFGVLLLAGSALALTGTYTIVDSDGYYNCNIQTNGQYNKNVGDFCKVVWDGVWRDCDESNREASFTVGASGQTVTSFTISHLDGVADDSFEVLDGTTPLSPECKFTEVTHGGWKTLTCNVNFDGPKVLTIRPLANAWDYCNGYGQVAVDSITFEYTEDNNIPEFGTIAALIGLAGAATGFFLLRRK